MVSYKSSLKSRLKYKVTGHVPTALRPKTVQSDVGGEALLFNNLLFIFISCYNIIYY